MASKIDLSADLSRVVDESVAILQLGGIIVFPTDTGYAIGCDLYSKKSIDRIYQLKGRGSDKPLSFICSDLSQTSEYAVVADSTYQIMKKVLPGPYTFVLPASRRVPSLVVSQASSVGIRMPKHPLVGALVSKLQHPIIGTSCSTPEGKAFETAEAIRKYFGKRIDRVLDVGKVASSPSSVVDFSHGEKPVIIRKGQGDLKFLKNAL